MKKTHIVGIIMILVAIGLLTSVTQDVSTYATFSDAVQSGEKVKIAGQLSKDKEMLYDPAIDPNYFSFYIKDAQEEERKVVLLAAKPQDFEKSEQIVLTGSMKGEEFVATEMLMKCPSKYKDEEIYIRS
ncbi:MAG: cytochrome c maturation protein CcmE, partial [Saprospiraceae bacterium]